MIEFDLEDCDIYEDDLPCEGCGRSQLDDGADFCSLCCPHGGYAPGTEECDFCEYSDECAEGAI